MHGNREEICVLNPNHQLMGTTALREFLKSLCSNSYWKYAVLWEPRHENRTILTWEDGYFDFTKSGEYVSTDVYCNAEADLFSSAFDANVPNCSGEELQIGLVMADMSHVQYSLGEGVVGKVAITREHVWLSVNNTLFCKESTKLVPEFPEEWLLQLAAGIKTILLVPVLPHGVLQLGSFVEVAEDIHMLAYIRQRFHVIKEDIVPLTLKTDQKREFKTQTTPASATVELFTAPPTIDTRPLKCEDLVNSFNQDDYKQQEPFKCESKNSTSLPISTEVSIPTEAVSASQLGFVESRLCYLMEELQAYSDRNEFDKGFFRRSLNDVMDSYPAADVSAELSGIKIAYDVHYKNRNTFLSFPRGSELHKALGPPFWSQTIENSGEPSLLVEDRCWSSNIFSSEDDRARGGDVPYLLEAMVGHSHIGDTPNISQSFQSSEPSPLHFSASSQKHFQTSFLVGHDLVPRKNLTPAFGCRSGDTDSTSAASKSEMCAFIGRDQQEEGFSGTDPRKGQKMTNATTRVRPSRNQRHRPRDRQLIQDRLKELRELVPNGTKCSIDGLLDQTIKHMQYLSKVTDQAEKLRRCVHQEVAHRTNCGPLETKQKRQRGNSWAFEELQACPIVVEDLAHPGQMLIEMLCNDRGIFLELAQAIVNLDLTILKGIMECRTNEIWAHFIVEASKGFHRLDIFWPLMQLLQRKRNSVSSRI